MKEEQDNENNSDRVRRLLKELPPVKASSDFDARLRRRISNPEGAGVENGWMERLFGPRRIPAFAYSLVALLSVGVISYYMFRHEEISPKLEIRDGSPPLILKDNEKIQQAPLVKEEEADKRQRDDLVSGAKKSDESRKVTIQSEPADQSSAVEKPLNLQKRLSRSGPSAQRIQQNVQSIQQNASRSVESQREEVSLPPANSPSESMDAVTESAAAGMERSLVGKAASGAAPKMESVYSVQEKSMKSMADPRGREFVRSSVDSAALADSAKVDSIRRAQKKLLLQKGKAKTKKPLR